MRKIFLSYAHEDRATAEEICYAIRESGYSVFFDRDDLPSGGDYHSRIRRAIEQSDFFVYLVSSRSTQKGCYALTELKFAKEKWRSPSGRILPVLVQPTDLRMIDRYLASVTVLEPTGNAAAEVAAALETLLREATKTSAPPSFEDLSFDRLSKAGKGESNEIRNRYMSMNSTNPTDGFANYGLALCYLHTKLYDRATEHFRRAVELLPDYPDAHYYYGLSLIRGRRPKTLSLKEVRRIEECLQGAIQLDGRPAKYYYLAAILKYDYYLANGLSAPPPSPADLISMAYRKVQDPGEIERLLQSVTLRDEALVSSIRGE
jgi:tetratricopeptide (TPR) repeat protein